MPQIFQDFFSHLHSEIWPVFNSGSRLFYVHIVLSGLIAILFLVFFKNQSLKEIFWKPRLKDYWLNPSAKVDYQIYILNGLIKIIYFAPVFGLSYYFSKYTVKFLFFLSPDFDTIQPQWGSIFICTFFVFVWDDFLRFIHHYMMHRFDFLWQLHKTHHSARVLTPITLFRIHPLESFMATVRNAMSFGVSSGFLMFLFSGHVEIMTLVGVNVFGFVFNLMMGNLRHSHIDLSFGFLENFFISPKQHQIHHSSDPQHFNKNYGVALSIWDQLFGTLQKSKNQKVTSFGVDGVNPDSVLDQFWPWPKL